MIEVENERADVIVRKTGKRIDVEDIRKADTILQQYKSGKANLDNRVVEAEEWYKLRHWEYIEHSESQVKPVSAWLFNCLANKHADAMDAFPAANILPREDGDKEEAKRLSSIVPVILDQCDFEQTYSDVWDYKLRTGTGVYGVFWDPTKLNGLGDINIVQADILSLFWEPGKKDIQDSANFFAIEAVDNETLVAMHPELKDKLSGGGVDTVKYVHDDNVETSDQSAVVSWYYKVKVGGRTVVQYVQYVGDYILYSSEDDPDHPEYAETGFYSHGLYPYVFDTLFHVAGTPAGFGYVDVGKSPQEYIDRGNQAAMESMLANASPRYLARLSAGINKEQFADLNAKVIDYTGDPNALIQIKGEPFDSSYIQLIHDKVDELKETTGNRDSNNGGTTSGVTAAAAIAAMQEAGSKLSRDSGKAGYRAFKKLILMVIELIRQFYDAPRMFRITGDQGQDEFVEYKNTGLQPQPQPKVMGVDVGSRVPLFDLKVVPQKASPYTQMAQNELAMQLYDKGFFEPERANTAMACLEMMDFDGKQKVMSIISKNGGIFAAMQQQIMQLSEIVDSLMGTNVSENIPQLGAPPPNMGGQNSGIEDMTEESSVTKNARARTAQAIQPR